jgi:hypothetical protein
MDVDMCEHLLRLNDAKMRRHVDVLNCMAELYAVQTTFFEENLATMSSLSQYMRTLLSDTAAVRRLHPPCACGGGGLTGFA